MRRGAARGGVGLRRDCDRAGAPSAGGLVGADRRAAAAIGITGRLGRDSGGLCACLPCQPCSGVLGRATGDRGWCALPIVIIIVFTDLLACAG